MPWPLLLYAAMLVASAPSPAPRDFLPDSYEQHPGEYYATQAREWAEHLRGDCANEDDWLQYFLHARFANRRAGAGYDLAAITERAGDAVHLDGFAVNYMRYTQATFPQAYTFLERAYAAEPEEELLQSPMLGYAMVRGDTQLAHRVSQRIDSQHPYPAGLRDFNYNLLLSVAPNGVLLTFGDADTYPAWVLQQANGVRQDVLVVSYSLLPNADYRSTLAERLGLPELRTVAGTEVIDFLRKGDRPMHLAGTAGDLLTNLGIAPEQLFTVGLTFRISDRPIENVAETERLLLSWRLDQLRTPLASDARSRAGGQFDANYLVPLVEIQRYRQQQNVPDDGLENMIYGLADRLGLRAEVMGLLSPPAAAPELASAQPGLTAAAILKAYEAGNVPRRPREVSRKDFIPDFVMKTTEVSNAEYQLFLEDLLRQRKFDYLDSAAIVVEENWLAYLPDSLKDLSPAVLYPRGRPESGDHPVVNLTHRAAELYAAWLTQVYNRDPKRPRGLEVRFRLPTASEFELAARGGKQYAPYPWGGPYYRNSKGCILGNLNTALIDDEHTSRDYQGLARQSAEPVGECNGDGYYLTAPVDSYYPNNYGLFNMSGNAAEMTDVDGQTMGGSWLDGPEALKNGTITPRELPSPSTGFRLVMEYVTE
ncbi:formylglycine-generating enzyme family protein [Lewinella sp. IMCC34191]|uniref:formylglycine-generating enzyme family protein n=1 Tax=Lewinella sp. IMCC34191 TaxID=2259172 RepID=UPI000E24A1BE|nr:SUMF1/EgtB/PvdO family nonheme iron enzyme [Lewinella sp. IMCC34191]